MSSEGCRFRLRDEVASTDEFRYITSNLDTSPRTMRFIDPLAEQSYVVSINCDRRPVYFLTWCCVTAMFLYAFANPAALQYPWIQGMSLLVVALGLLSNLLFTVLLLLSPTTLSPGALSRFNELAIYFFGATSILSFALAYPFLPNACYREHGRSKSAASEECVGIFDEPFLLACFSHVAVAPRLTFCGPTFVLAVIFIFISRFSLALDDEERKPNTTYVQLQISMMVLVLITCVVLVYFRERMMRSHFKADMRQRRAAADVIRNTAEVDGVISWLLPPSAMGKLLAGDKVLESRKATVMFADLAGFTAWCSTRSATDVTMMLNEVVGALDALSLKCGVTKVKTMGDCYWTVCGMPDTFEDHAQRTVELAGQIHSTIATLAASSPEWGTLLFRIGIHSGQVIGAVLGITRLAYEVFGVVCTVAQELEGAAELGQVLISSAVARYIGLPVLKPFIVDEKVAHTSMGPVNAFALDRLQSELPVQKERQPLQRPERGLVRQFRQQYDLRGAGVRADSPSREAEIERSPDPQSFDRFQQASCVWQAFADEELEAEYREFALRTSFRQGVVATAVLATFLWGLMVCSSLVTYSPVLLFIPTLTYALCALLVTALLVVNTNTKRLDTIRTTSIFVLVFTLTLIAALFSVDSQMVRSLYSTQIFCMVTIFGGLPDKVSGISVIYFYGLEIALRGIVGNLTAYSVFIPFSPLVFFVVLMGMEAIKRREFIAHTLAGETLLSAQQEMEVLESVIRKVVPAFVVRDLMRQYQSDVRSPLTFEKENVAVLFCKFSWGSQVDYQQSFVNSKSQIMESTREVEGDFDHPRALAAEEDILGVEKQWMENYDDNEDYVRVCGMLSDSVDGLLPQPDIQTGNHTFEDMAKVKTIGDVVMVAGPLEPTAQLSVRECPNLCRQMLLFALSLRKVVLYSLHTDKVVATMGMHIGPLTAAVIGKQQLMYDIFGPTVNAASRVMTTNKVPGQIAVSGLFNQYLEQISGEIGIPGLDIGAEETCRAKGIGQMTKHQVLHEVVPMRKK